MVHIKTIGLAALIGLATACHAQTNLSSPVKILRVPTGPGPGELRLCDNSTSCTTFGDIGITGNNAFKIAGRASSNGVILLQPGNVPGLAEVHILAPRDGWPGLVIQDHSSAANNGLQLWDSSNVAYFSLDGSAGTKDATFTALNSNRFQFLNGEVAMGGLGGPSGYIFSSTHPTLGFNTLGLSSPVAGVTGFGGAFQFDNASGNLVYYTSASVSAGAARTLVPSLTILANTEVDVTNVLTAGSSTFRADSTGAFIQSSSVNQVQLTFTGAGGAVKVFNSSGTITDSIGASTGSQTSTQYQLYSSTAFSTLLAQIKKDGGGAGQLILNNSSGQNMIVADETQILMQNAGTNQVQMTFTGGTGGALKVMNNSGTVIGSIAAGTGVQLAALPLQVYTAAFATKVWDFTSTGMTISGVAGVTCAPGAPTALFQTSNGIVIHC